MIKLENIKNAISLTNYNLNKFHITYNFKAPNELK